MAYRSSSQLTGGNGATAAVPVPASAASGDIAIVGIYKENTAAITPPAGFTEKAALTTSGTARGTLYVFWKRLTGADSGTYSFSWTGSTFRGAAAALFSGRTGSGDPFDGTVGTAESTTSVATLNVSTSPANADGDAVGFWTNFTGGNSYTPPTNYTERQDLDVITLDTRDAVASGTTGSISATSNVSGFQKAFLGVLALAGGSDATATPAAVTSVVATPQATPSISKTTAPAVTTAVVAAPQATPAVSDSGTPAATGVTVAVPQAAISAAATVTPPSAAAATVSAPQATPSVADVAAPDPVAAVVALPAATPQTSGNATVSPAAISVTAALPQTAVAVATGPATVTATVTLPQATPLTAGNATATPAAVSTIVGVPAAAPSGAATASPASLAAVAALPQVSPLAGGNVTTSPSPVAVVAGLPAATPSAGSIVKPGVIVTAVAVPRAGVGTTVGPASIVVLAQLPAAVPVTTSSATRTPATIATVVAVPHASAFAEGVGVRGRIGELSARLPGGVVARRTFDSGGTIR